MLGNMEKEKAKAEAMEAMLEEMLELALQDPDFPPDRKINLLLQYTNPEFSDEASRRKMPGRKAMLEYLKLVEVGIDQFVAQMEKESGGL